MTRENLGKLWMYAQVAAYCAVVGWIVAFAPILVLGAIYAPDGVWPFFKLVSGYELFRLLLPQA